MNFRAGRSDRSHVRFGRMMGRFLQIFILISTIFRIKALRSSLRENRCHHMHILVKLQFRVLKGEYSAPSHVQWCQGAQNVQISTQKRNLYVQFFQKRRSVVLQSCLVATYWLMHVFILGSHKLVVPLKFLQNRLTLSFDTLFGAIVVASYTLSLYRTSKTWSLPWCLDGINSNSTLHKTATIYLLCIFIGYTFLGEMSGLITRLLELLLPFVRYSFTHTCTHAHIHIPHSLTKTPK